MIVEVDLIEESDEEESSDGGSLEGKKDRNPNVQQGETYFYLDHHPTKLTRVDLVQI